MSDYGYGLLLRLEDRQLRALAALARDPVCGMLLDPARSAGDAQTAQEKSIELPAAAQRFSKKT